MRCPFLREAQVKFCRASAYRKMIVRLPEQSKHERCTSPEYVNCPAVKQHSEEHPSVDHCPFLHESLVQYCTAAAVTKYIPYSESVLSRCGTESYKYCDLYLAFAQPQDTTELSSSSHNGVKRSDDEIRVPSELYFSPNHMWMDIGNDDIVHIGIDAFLAKVIGSADHVTFATTTGFHRPTVSFTIRGVDLPFVFPIPVHLLRANTYLRTHPEKIFSDPYTHGWLFEASLDRFKHTEVRHTSLLSGNEARLWMNNELQRLNTFVHNVSAQPDKHGVVLMSDGGSFQTGFVHLLAKEELLKLYNDFFSPLAVWNTQL